MCTFIKENNFTWIYLYVDIALRILVCTPISHCSTERSFLTLKKIKSYHRSCSGEEKLYSLAVMSIEAYITSKIDYNDIIEKFSHKTCRKKN